MEVLQGVGRWLKVNGEAIHGAGRTAFGEEFGAPIPPPKAGNTAPPKEWRCEVCGASQKKASQFEPSNDWRCTTKPFDPAQGTPDRLYIHIFNWPASGTFNLPAVKGKISKAYLLADPQKAELKVTQTESGLAIALPAKAPDPIASVVCLKLQ